MVSTPMISYSTMGFDFTGVVVDSTIASGLDLTGVVDSTMGSGLDFTGVVGDSTISGVAP